MLDSHSLLLPIIRRALGTPASRAFLDRKIRSVYRRLADSYPEEERDQEEMIQELPTRLSRVLTAANGGGGVVRQVHGETVVRL